MNTAQNPVTKLMNALCGIIAVTIKAAIAMLHQGKYKQAIKLKRIIKISDTANFIKSI
jgi:hypothetical protein